MGEVRFRNIPLTSIKVVTNHDYSGAPQYASLNSDRLMTNALRVKIQNMRAIIQFSKANTLGFKREEIGEQLLDDLEQLQDIRNDISHHAAPHASKQKMNCCE